MRLSKVDAYFWCLVVFMLQPFFELIVPFFKYYDEAIVLIFFIYSVFKSKGKISMMSVRVLGLSALLIPIGLVGNLFSQSGQPSSMILQDIVSNLKFPLFAVAINKRSLTEYEKEYLSGRLHAFLRMLFAFMAVTAVLSQIVNIGMSSKMRYGISAYHFIFRNPAVLNTYCYLYIIAYIITLKEHGTIRKNAHLFAILGVIPWVLTLRSRAFSFAAIFAFLYWRMIVSGKSREGRKFHWFYVLVALAGAVLISWDAIVKYFLDNNRSARFQLLKNAFELAREYFPVGSGFATFGTEASRAHYSSIYYRYGMNLIYGLSPAYPSFVTDQYWFGILGQFGASGILCVGFIIWSIYKKAWVISKQDPCNRLAVYMLFMTSLFASITAGTFIQASILPSLLVIYLFGQENPASLPDRRALYGGGYRNWKRK